MWKNWLESDGRLCERTAAGGAAMRKDIFPELKKQLMERLRMEQELGDEQVLETGY